MGCCGRPDPKPPEPKPLPAPTLQEQLLAKWTPTIRQSDHIKTWTGDGELAYIMEQATKASFAVEIGTYLGKSAKCMLDANPNLHLWCVDPGIVDFISETACYFMRDEIAQGRCEVIKKYSQEAAPMLEHMRGKLDLVFIDGNHAFDYVYLDLKLWVPLVRSGGIVCGHDWEAPPSYPKKNDVARAVEFVLFDKVTEPVPRIWQHIKP